FYKHLFQQKQRPAAALRAAQLEMVEQTPWKSPYYWAAFTVNGDF
ncbi:MAG: CHAT domain-containing protein, partial [Blastocatellia bacterium]|nr:CHAT domain-containing protein [Blastocatellia bacterium]